MYLVVDLFPQDRSKFQEPTSLFEHFIVTGLHPDANLEAVEHAFARRKKWEAEVARSDELDGRSFNYRGPSPPALDPQVQPCIKLFFLLYALNFFPIS